MDDKVAELARSQSEMTGRMQTVAEVFGSRQSDFVAPDLRAARGPAAPGRAGARGLDPAPGRAPDEAQRAPGGDRRGAEEPHRPHRRGRRPQGHPGQQAGARRLRPGPHGGDHPRWAARRRLRVPGDALEPHPAGLPRATARRRARPRRRRQVSARMLHPVPRRDVGRGAPEGRPAGARRHRRPRPQDLPRSTSSRARRRTWR